jgi:hypothetical protein
MYNCCDDTVHFQRRDCSTSPAKGVQLERYIHLTTFNVYIHTNGSAKKTEMDYITNCFTALFNGDDDE